MKFTLGSAKAVVGAVIAGLGSLLSSLTANDGHLTLTQGLTAALITLVALNTVWVVPNKVVIPKPPPNPPAPPPVVAP